MKTFKQFLDESASGRAKRKVERGILRINAPLPARAKPKRVGFNINRILARKEVNNISPSGGAE